MGLKKWATRDLRSGDLTALLRMAQGTAAADDDRTRRLSQRGFVNLNGGEQAKITAKGRIAIIIKRTLLSS